jgi:DNA-binding response OmpR family regulator
MHIGVLDDNSSILEYLKTTLELAGSAVSTHTAGRSLLDALFPGSTAPAPLPYNLVILDLLLSEGLSGKEVFLTIRASIPREQLPVIFLTAASDQEIQHLRMSIAEPILVLRKPFRPQELLQMVASCGGIP